MFCAYQILFETKKEYCCVGPLTANEKIEAKDIEKALRKYLDPDVANMEPFQIYNMVAVATDGDYIEVVDLNPEDFFPLHLEETDKFFDFKKGMKENG